MGKLKIEKGASKVRREPLKVTIDGSVADDLKLMCDWSENDLSYVVNLLLDFAITQSEDFQKYKTERGAAPATARNEPRPGSDPVRRPAPAQPEKGAIA
ncbi:MAG TPA: hypothetical protein VGR47_08460 [Terracidiphilus sp.]|nr:hypothetical protein [Terracidiphilus sp.]HEV2398029.1 hypothetical protein [Candidatus Sulfotelmatobacter sp.]